MKVSELQQFPQDKEVLISDGYVGNFYSGNYDILEYVDEDNQSYVDIGIGGLNQSRLLMNNFCADLFVSNANSAYLYSDGSQRYGQFLINQFKTNFPHKKLIVIMTIKK